MRRSSSNINLETLPRLICSGQFDEKTLCILSPRFLVRLLENDVTDVFCETVDGVAVCWKAPSKSEENRNSIWSTLGASGYLVSLLDRFAYHPHEVTMDLRQGFSLPEGEILLASCLETQVPLLLDPSQRVQKVLVDLTPLNAGDSGRTFSVWIGPHRVGDWTLKTRSTIAIEIPKEAWTTDGPARRILPLIFKWDHSASPRAAGAALPAPTGFHELRLQY